MTPEQWRDWMTDEFVRHKKEVDIIYCARRKIKFPPITQLRRANANDIKVGAVIYHTDGDENAFWNVVDELKHYGDDFKAYTADDGCRYGLHNAFVRKDAK